MRMTVLVALVLALGSSARAAPMPEGKKLPLVCLLQHELVATNALKHVDLFIGRGMLKGLSVAQEPRNDIAAGHRIVVSGSVISENTGLPKQGTLIFIGKAGNQDLLLSALSDCDGRFRVRISAEQLSDKLYLSERGLYHLLEYEIPEPRTKTENPNKMPGHIP
jgi:hypothetical protein